MTTQEKLDAVKMANPDALLADGFEDALIGYRTVFRHGPLAVYDHSRCVEILMRRDGMTEEEANEYMDFNVTGAYVGENTPAFITLLEKDPDPVCLVCKKSHPPRGPGGFPTCYPIQL